MARLFISYAKPDRASAELIAEYLREGKHESLFLEPEGRKNIAETLASADRLIAVLTPEYLRSQDCAREWEEARRQGILIRVRLQEARLGSLGPFGGAIDLVGLEKETAKTYLLAAVDRALRRQLRPESPPAMAASTIAAKPGSREGYRSALEESLASVHSELWSVMGPNEALSAEALSHLVIELNTTTEILVQAKAARTVASGPIVRKVPRKRTAFEAAMAHHRVIFLGGPGSGKSTLLKQLASQPPLPELLPVYLKLGEALTCAPVGKADEQKMLWEYVGFWLRQRGLEDYLSKAPAGDGLVLLLDGLDEVPRGESRSQIRRSIERFADSCPNSRIIVTCRTSAYREDPDARLYGWAQYELSPLDDNQVDGFIDNWSRYVLAGREDLPKRDLSLAEICHDPSVQQLIRSPLLLTLIAWAYTFSFRPLSSRAQLLEHAVDLILWKWEIGKTGEEGLEPQLSVLLREAGVSREACRACLDRLAFEALCETHLREKVESAGAIRESLAVEQVRQLHPEHSSEWTRQVLEALRLRTGLIGGSPGEGLHFSNLAFQEFMAGSHLARQPNFGKKAADLLAQSLEFREMVLFAVGCLASQWGDYERPLALVDALSRQGDDVDWKRIWLAGRALLEIGPRNTEGVPIGPSLLGQVKSQLTQLIETGALSPPDRASAGGVLASLGDPRFDAARFYLPAVFRGRPEALLGFIKVTAGPFVMGSIGGDRDADTLEIGNPENLTIPYDYWIGRYPVTVAQYQMFMEDGGYEISAWWSAASGIGWRWRQISRDMKYSEGDPYAWLWEFPDLRSSRSQPADWQRQQRFPNWPVTGVCWFEALAYAAWLDDRLRGKGWIPEGYVVRLPAEDEWEKAARPFHRNDFPWGASDWTEQRSNTLKSRLRQPTPVGMYPDGASKLEVHDLSGNVREWSLSALEPYPYLGDDGRNDPGVRTARRPRVLRGGSFQLGIREARSASRSWDLPHACRADLGFRLALSVPVSAGLSSGE